MCWSRVGVLLDVLGFLCPAPSSASHSVRVDTVLYPGHNSFRIERDGKEKKLRATFRLPGYSFSSLADHFVLWSSFCGDGGGSNFQTARGEAAKWRFVRVSERGGGEVRKQFDQRLQASKVFGYSEVSKTSLQSMTMSYHAVSFGRASFFFFFSSLFFECKKRMCTRSLAF